MTNYDGWLAAPGLAAMEASEAFCDWCEDRDIDPESDEAFALFNEWLEEG